MKLDSREVLADITLLFELSLAAGTSLDLEENCRRFLTTLMARKNLDLAAVWLRPDDPGASDDRDDRAAQEPPGGPYHLVYAAPAAHVGIEEVTAGEELAAKLAAGRGFGIPARDSSVVGLFASGEPVGTCALFPLSRGGFLALHSSFEGAFEDGRELRQLDGVVRKFAISIDGCIAHARAMRELGERKKAEAERAQIQDQLHQAEKMDAIGRLAGGVAHDFNNLLTGILGCAEILGRMNPTDEQRAVNELIVGAAKNAAELTGQLLALSHRGGTEQRPVAVDDVVSQTVGLLRRTLGPRITLRTDLSLGPAVVVLASPSRLANALLNLGVNARDAIEGEGTIDVSTVVVDLDEEFCHRHGGTIDPGPYARIRVADTGVGMDAETSARVFEPFFSTKLVGRGTGLGLATVYGTVTGLGGLITVETRPTEGATFDIFLPVVAAAPQPPEVEAPPAALTPAGTLLLVDDDADVRWVLERMGISLGYRVVAVADGPAALSAIAAEVPDVILLDVQLGGLSGPEVLAEIRRGHPDLPVVAVSGFADQAAIDRLRELGIRAFLPKPFTLEALAACLGPGLPGRP